MRHAIKVLIVYVVGLLSIPACMFLLVVASTVVGHLTRPKVYEVTTPLEEEVVQDLCQKLALAEDDPLCQVGAVVYAPDFFPAVRASFQRGVTTYEDVQEKFGEYQYERQSLVTQADGTAYFMCGYDFNGDRVFPVWFSFTKESILERVFATVGDD